MIKYLGSKRRLVPTLNDIIVRLGARTAIDLFTGTTRVAQGFKQNGVVVTAVDVATYAHIAAQCYIETDSASINSQELHDIVHELNQIPGREGYFTKTFCEDARFFHPKNGMRVDAIRDFIEQEYSGSPLFPILLTSLMEAADRVDSTTGVQMAYLKSWAPRALNDIELRVPSLLPGAGRAILGRAEDVIESLDIHDVAYLDPPYNQHRYFTNYHIWETLVRWDEPEAYGIARKRIDSKDDETKSRFNKKREMPEMLRSVAENVPAKTVVLSYNNESWVGLDDLVSMLSPRGHVEVLMFDSKRYVGAQIGIHNLSGERVGEVSHLRNVEYVLIAGEKDLVQHAAHGISSLKDDHPPPEQVSLF